MSLNMIMLLPRLPLGPRVPRSSRAAATESRSLTPSAGIYPGTWTSCAGTAAANRCTTSWPELLSTRTPTIAFQLYRCTQCEAFYEHIDHSFTYGFPAVGKLFAHLRDLRVDAVERAYASTQ